MSRARQLAAPLWFAAARLPHRRGQIALVPLGLAAAAAALAAVVAGSAAAQDQSLARGVAALRPDVRVIRLNSFGVAGQSESYESLDAEARGVLQRIVARNATATILYRESTIAGRYMGLGAVDRLGRHILLRSGRLPRACRPARCEVVQLRGSPPPPSVPGLRLVRVGRGDLRTTMLFGDAVPPAKNRLYVESLSEHYRRASRYHQPPSPPLYLAEGVAGLAESSILTRTFRSYGWVVPLRPEDVRPWSARSLVARIDRARTSLEARAEQFELRAPTDEIVTATRTAEVAGRRLLLLGGLGVALLLAFAGFAAASLRHDADAVRQRLTWLGAPRWQQMLVVTAEAVLVAAAAATAGWICAAAVAAVGIDGGRELVAHSILSVGGVALGAALAATSALVLVFALLIGRVRFAGRSVSPLDVAAVAAVAGIALALARGVADPSATAERGTAPLLLLLPGVVGFAGAVAAARALAPALRLTERLTPRRFVSFRLAAVTLARRPGSVAVAVAFVVVSVGLALFAATYAATLARGQRDQAQFAVPADFVLREDLSRLIPVREAATPAAVARLGDGVRAAAVTRHSSSLRGSAAVTGITVLGLDPALLPALDGWRAGWANTDLPGLARRIDSGDVALGGPLLARGASSVALPLDVTAGAFAVALVIQARDGSFVEVDLGPTRAGRHTLRAALPRSARGGRVIALRFDPPPRIVEAGANAGGAAEALVRLEPMLVRGKPRARVGYGGWVGVNGVERGAADPLRLHLTLTNTPTAYFRPRQPTDGSTVAAIVSPRLRDLAGPDGVLGVEVAGESVRVRAAAVAARFPGTDAGQDDDFVVADRDALLAALNVSRPGAGFTNELWVNAPADQLERVARRLREPPFDVLAMESQRAIATELEHEPLARGALAMLTAAAAVALALALAGLLLAALAQLRDEHAELFELETQGAGPKQLGRQLRSRLGIILAFGLGGAALTALALGVLVVRLVAVTASATRPEPPLVLAVEWSGVALGIAAVGVGALLLGGIVTTRALARTEVHRESAVAR